MSRRRSALLAMMVLLCTLFVTTSATAQNAPPVSPIMLPDPGSDLWRAARQREAPAAGKTQVRGVETGVLIERSGDDWRLYRVNYFIGYAAVFMAGVTGLILLFYLVRGRIPIEGGRSGRRIKRFADVDRTVHWLVAVLFIFLGLTGLLLLFGRYVVLPLIGPEAFSVIASASKEGHNLFGPLFLVAVVLLFARFAAKNFPARGDLKWLAKGGGIVGKGHASAGFFNAGEKIWFWMAIVLGLVVSLTGLVLVFPVFGQGREIMQIALIVHGAAAVLFIAGSFGHIYIGTVGTEGSLESMTTGYVDENWAKAHHDRWYEEVRDATGPASAQGAGAVGTAPAAARDDRL